ncbi:MAG: 50S ribosomal protein L13 [Patescibacteria group bacterium]
MQNQKTTKFQYNVKRATHQLDATNQAVGRLASTIAGLLMGKNRPDYSPHIDCGDQVEVINSKLLKFTGKKLDQKEYIRHTGYPAGLRRKKMKEVFAQNPAEVIRQTVYKMLPKNKLRPIFIKRLKVK